MLVLSGSSAQARVLLGLPVRGWGLLPVRLPRASCRPQSWRLPKACWLGRGAIEPVFSQLMHSGEPALEDEPQRLSERDGQVLQLLALGLANKQIARQLQISEHTVKFHVSSIFTKLGASSRTEAIRIGVQRGLVSI